MVRRVFEGASRCKYSGILTMLSERMTVEEIQGTPRRLRYSLVAAEAMSPST